MKLLWVFTISVVLTGCGIDKSITKFEGKLTTQPSNYSTYEKLHTFQSKTLDCTTENRNSLTCDFDRWRTRKAIEAKYCNVAGECFLNEPDDSFKRLCVIVASGHADCFYLHE